MFGPGVIEATTGGLILKAGRSDVLFLHPDEINRSFGDAALVSDDGRDRMVALTLRTKSLEAAANAISAAPGVRRDASRLLVPHGEACGVALAFIA
jgi:hypothetical protein